MCNYLQYIENGKTPQEAVEETTALVNKRISSTYNAMGLVAIDAHGRIGAAYSSPKLCWAYMTADRKEPVASKAAKILK